MIALHNDRTNAFISDGERIRQYLEATNEIVAMVDRFIGMMQEQEEYTGFLSLEFYGRSPLYPNRLLRQRKTVTPRHLFNNHPTYNALHYALYFPDMATAMETMNSMLINPGAEDAFEIEHNIVSFWQHYEETHPQPMRVEEDGEEDGEEERHDEYYGQGEFSESGMGSLEVEVEDDE